MFDEQPCWTIDWREFFKSDTKPWHKSLGGEMRRFHVVSHLRIEESGKLAFWTGDGCVIARNGKVIHSDRGAHPPTRTEIDVQRGERLRVAQWQSGGEWLWGAQPVDHEKESRLKTPADLVHFYLGAVRERLRHPNGPPLKMCLSGGEPVRTIVGLYSMILNGYSPSRVILFGEHQWNQRSRELFATAFPFAEFVSTERLLEDAGDIGGSRLIEMAQQYWWVFKSLMQSFWPPEESCAMDDDVFILDRVDDALEALEQCDLVYTPDMYNWSHVYLETWGALIDGGLETLPTTGMVNTGLFWMRQFADRRKIANYVLNSEPGATNFMVYDQGLVATLYARRSAHQLSTQRYFFPLCDGLPGGLPGYDYAGNPCGFASVHFAGLLENPSEPLTLWLAPQILGRKPELQICPF